MRVLRELRTQRGLTLQGLADSIGLTPGYLSQIERGQGSPSVATLTRLAGFYGVPVSFFFEDDGDGVSVTRNGTHLILRPHEKGAEFQLLSPDLKRRIEFLRIVIEPGAATHSHFNTHPGEEVHYVIDGALEVEIGGRTYTLAKGDSIYFHSTLPHRMRNPGTTPSVVLTAMSPPTRCAKEMFSAHGGEMRRRGRQREVASSHDARRRAR